MCTLKYQLGEINKIVALNKHFIRNLFFYFFSKSVRSRRTQTSPTPSSPDQGEESAEKNNVIVVWPMASVESQNSVHI